MRPAPVRCISVSVTPVHRGASRAGPTWWGRIAVAVAVTLLATVVAPPGAWAHNRLLRAEPGDGATLHTTPAAVTLMFAEPPDSRFVQLAVTAPHGGPGAAGEPAVRATAVVQPVTDAGPGRYTVAYRVTSTDGHPVSGTVAFTVAATSFATVTPPEATASPVAGGIPGASGGPVRPWWYAVGGLGLLLVAVAGWWIVRRATGGEGAR